VKIGTKSLLFGVHQFALHPWFVAAAWWKLYGFPIDPRLWVAFFVHDIGYWGKPNMDGREGEEHPLAGANIMRFLFDGEARHPFTWYGFCLYHSRFYAKKHGAQFSRLCVADKLAIALVPQWLYLIQARLTGELEEYMRGTGARTPAGERTPQQWLTDCQRYCREWAIEHQSLKEDSWTGTIRDLAR
jgi:hypothetical protein